ncbi:MFS transporter [Georgenia sp. AZ-5]|uniref:MFS transporter n=1 Tax=Georgenia sp. AZ-5 TaxID=3367526 RepID=UPI0037552A66
MTAAAPRAGDAARQRTNLPLLMVGLMLAMLLSALNQTVLATALPTMVGELDGVDRMQWAVTAFILASTVAMPVYGRLGDAIGRKGLLVAAIVLFMAGSVIGALATGMDAMIVARVVQGLGGGGLMILSQALLADVVPARDRGKYMGIMGSVFAVSSVAGPLLGGWFTEGPGWRWAFWVNLPLGAVAVLAAFVLVRVPARARTRVHVDYLGMALLTAATTGAVLVGTWGGTTYAWNSTTLLATAAATLIAAVLFVMVERRAAEPVLPPHLFRNRNFVLTTLGGLLTHVAMFGTLGYMPTYLQMATGASASVAGLLMVPMMGMLLVTSMAAGHLVARTGRYRTLTVVSTVAVAGALALLSATTPATPVWVISAELGLLGAGLGPGMQILVLVAQNAFPHALVGTVTAGHNYFRQVGASVGAAVVGSVFASRVVTLLGERLPGSQPGSLTPAMVADLPERAREAVVASYTEALPPVLLLIAPLALLAAVLLAFIVEQPLAPTLGNAAPGVDGRPRHGSEAPRHRHPSA